MQARDLGVENPKPSAERRWRRGLGIQQPLVSHLQRWTGATLDLLHPPVCGACLDLLDGRASGVEAGAPILPALIAEPFASPASISATLDPCEVLPRLLPLCPGCATSLDAVPEPCQSCGEPDSPFGTCRHCAEFLPAFSAAFAPFHYGAAIRDLLRRFKYGDSPELARPLAQSLACALPKPLNFDLVSHVPLHWRRRWSRGYDQALLLAAKLAPALKLPFDPHLLRRHRATRRQVGNSRHIRQQNVESAFSAGKNLHQWEGARVLLVDDVVTTGATANACAEFLLRSGISNVQVASVARAG